MAAMITVLPFGCSVCRDQVTFSHIKSDQAVYKCRRCGTTIAVPEGAWQHTTIKKT